MISIVRAPQRSVKAVTLLATILLCLWSTAAFSQPLYLSVNSTPYDKQMTRIRSIFLEKSDVGKQDLNLAMVNHWIEDLRNIPYGYTPEWRTPLEVVGSPIADCKGKAVALYDKMQAHGASNIRLVIGKRTVRSRKTHAWLEWTTGDATFVLDPTINWAAYPLERLGQRAYIPLYAYSGPRKYRAVGKGLFASRERSWKSSRNPTSLIAQVSPAESHRSQGDAL